MTVVFYNKKKETFEVIKSVIHLHIDVNMRKKCFVLYTASGIRFYEYRFYDLHKIDG